MSISDYLKKFFSKSKPEIVSEAVQEVDEITFNLQNFSDIEASDIMIPKNSIIAASIDITAKELKALFDKEEHSRIPLYKNNIDEIEGFIHVKDLFKVLSKGNKIDIKNLLREIIYAPKSIKVINLLNKMRKSKIHIAIVVDEFGATAGLLTIEDVVELIVGDIDDEYDIDEENKYTKISESKYIIDAHLKVDEVEEIIGIAIHEGEHEHTEFDTLGGLIINQIGYIPKKGEKFKLTKQIEVEITAATKRTIQKVLIYILNH